MSSVITDRSESGNSAKNTTCKGWISCEKQSPKCLELSQVSQLTFSL